MLPADWPVLIVDLKDCFFTIPLHPDDRPKFAFTVPTINNAEPAQRYQWRVLPQGMRNSPMLCQWYVARALSGVRKRFPDAHVYHYMDDILVATPTQEELLRLQPQLLNALHSHGLQVAPEKVQQQPPWKYLGVKILERTIRHQEVQFVQSVKTLNDAQKLVGVITWLRPYLGLTTAQLSPLFELLKGDTDLKSPRELTPEARKVLEEVQQAVSACQVYRIEPSIDVTVFITTPDLHPTGVNPRGLKALELWQTDVTQVAEFGRLKYVHVTVDTFSSAMWASAHTGEKARDVIAHWRQAFAVLGIPSAVKTDNGPAYASQQVRQFLQSWGVSHNFGIPHSPTGQAIVERNHGLYSQSEEMSNSSSSISHFLLLALADTRQLQLLLFCLFLGISLAALLGNGLIISAVACGHLLHTPVFFFLLNLALTDLGSICTTVPKAMHNSLWDTRTISYTGCAAQLFSFLFFISAEFYLLTTMSYDRYVSICKPLHYGTLLGSRACAHMAAAAWASAFLNALMQTANAFSLPLCHGNALGQFFCEIPQILKLSCSKSYLRELGLIAVSACLALGCFVFIVFSYVQIFRAVLRIPSEQGRHKAFSTCLPHLAVVSLFLSTVMFAYLKPPSISSPSVDLALSVLYSVVPPALNPLIYSLRNQELKAAVRRQMTGWFQKH
ncbi:hypothetical protein DUI87_20873 [Hirundo rustica rustica]|uniref:ribonuclease H n=1 Tax=Hirundo rustica rustica TaxID=333673 RepID=A0A3M0JNQ0_HIRRU|nr:hypothetical protein DUI87_20873 [Hirundo rustica rustica]